MRTENIAPILILTLRPWRLKQTQKQKPCFCSLLCLLLAPGRAEQHAFISRCPYKAGCHGAVATGCTFGLFWLINNPLIHKEGMIAFDLQTLSIFSAQQFGLIHICFCFGTIQKLWFKAQVCKMLSDMSTFPFFCGSESKCCQSRCEYARILNVTGAVC